MAQLAAAAAGEQIGPYTILGKLASGGKGEIFRARDGRLSREVAIKFLVAGQGEEDALRFEQEARAIGSLAHAHVVTIFDVGQHGGHRDRARGAACRAVRRCW